MWMFHTHISDCEDCNHRGMCGFYIHFPEIYFNFTARKDTEKTTQEQPEAGKFVFVRL